MRNIILVLILAAFFVGSCYVLSGPFKDTFIATGSFAYADDTANIAAAEAQYVQRMPTPEPFDPFAGPVSIQLIDGDIFLHDGVVAVNLTKLGFLVEKARRIMQKNVEQAAVQEVAK